jgi:hypothetical protein
LGVATACPHRAYCGAELFELIGARAGNREDFEALYERYFARCFRVARRSLRSLLLAEICTRETLASMMRAATTDGGCLAVQVWELLQHSVRRENAHSVNRAPHPPLWEW